MCVILGPLVASAVLVRKEIVMATRTRSAMTRCVKPMVMMEIDGGRRAN